jgi:hypothetical protein
MCVITERRDREQRQRELQRQLKQEEATANALKHWNTEILPNWQTRYILYIHIYTVQLTNYEHMYESLGRSHLL